jgi:pimeloyl-ACP methyl ester carboxylesterase
MHQQNPLAIIHALGGMAGRRDNTKILHRANIPVLILVGENDILTPPEIARDMLKESQKGTLKIISKAGHLSNMENPQKFNEEFFTWYTQGR